MYIPNKYFEGFRRRLANPNPAKIRIDNTQEAPYTVVFGVPADYISRTHQRPSATGLSRVRRTIGSLETTLGLGARSGEFGGKISAQLFSGVGEAA